MWKVVYGDKITQGFGGGISRSATIAQVLEKFELTRQEFISASKAERSL